MEGQFLEKIVRFLKEVEWLYDFPVTQVFTRNVLSQIPEEWSASFADLTLSSLNGIPECSSQTHWPSSLKQFLKQCKELSLQQWINTSQHEYTIRKSPLDLRLPKELCKGMSPKKEHEVITMVQCVKELCNITNSSRILDIGSGMGYVDSALHHALGVTIVAAESEECRVRDAQKRQSLLTGSCEGIKHMKWLLQDDQATLDKALEIVHDLVNYKALCKCRLNSERNQSITPDTCIKRKEIDLPEETVSQSVMLIGLHSCADLSPVMIKIYKHCPKISSVVLFSCCYHKIENIDMEEHCKENENITSVECEKSRKVCTFDTTEVFAGMHKKESIEPCSSNVTSAKKVKEMDKVNTIKYKNFPMSNTLKQIMKVNDFRLSIYGLRLAAQESGVRWLQHTKEDHENHERNVAYRALLEDFCQKEGITLKKCRRRCARKSKFCSFNEYITAVLENYEFIPVKSEALNCENIESFVVKESSSETIKASERGICLSVSKDCVELGLKSKTQLSKELIRDRLKTCFSEYEDMFYLIEPLTGLQLALQPVLEALILLDRVAYLKEANFDKVWLEEVFDVAVSPRNVALIAVR
ncbi:probable methyltransferase-like protein 25 isoform X2 [Palaemon carinicauda]